MIDEAPSSISFGRQGDAGGIESVPSLVEHNENILANVKSRLSQEALVSGVLPQRRELRFGILASVTSAVLSYARECCV